MFMERNKWEAEFKAKLGQREITPTPHAWDRLDAMLNEADNKASIISTDEKPVRKLTWLYIAAGVAAVLLLATLLVKPQNGEQRNEVVEQPKQESVDSIGQPKIGADKNQNNDQNAETGPAHTQTPNVEENGSVRKRSNHRRSDNGQLADASQYNPSDNGQLATNEGQSAPGAQPNGAKLNLDRPATYGQRPTTDDQIASIEPSIPQPKTVKVDPKSLLSQVDGELEMTFREKAIKTISKKYRDVKVAVANRNNQ